MKFIKDKEEFLKFWHELELARQTCNCGQSDTFNGMLYWNCTDNEHRADFPTVYFPMSYLRLIA